RGWSGVGAGGALHLGGCESDVATARYAPPHSPRPPLFRAEAARVLGPGGRLAMFDNRAPEDGELDAFLNRLEVWRDPSHFRAHRSSEWREGMEGGPISLLVAEPLVR